MPKIFYNSRLQKISLDTRVNSLEDKDPNLLLEKPGDFFIHSNKNDTQYFYVRYMVLINGVPSYKTFKIKAKEKNSTNSQEIEAIVKFVTPRLKTYIIWDIDVLVKDEKLLYPVQTKTILKKITEKDDCQQYIINHHNKQTLADIANITHVPSANDVTEVVHASTDIPAFDIDNTNLDKIDIVAQYLILDDKKCEPNQNSIQSLPPTMTVIPATIDNNTYLFDVVNNLQLRVKLKAAILKKYTDDEAVTVLSKQVAYCIKETVDLEKQFCTSAIKAGHVLDKFLGKLSDDVLMEYFPAKPSNGDKKKKYTFKDLIKTIKGKNNNFKNKTKIASVKLTKETDKLTSRDEIKLCIDKFYKLGNYNTFANISIEPKEISDQALAQVADEFASCMRTKEFVERVSILSDAVSDYIRLLTFVDFCKAQEDFFINSGISKAAYNSDLAVLDQCLSMPMTRYLRYKLPIETIIGTYKRFNRPVPESIAKLGIKLNIIADNLNKKQSDAHANIEENLLLQSIMPTDNNKTLISDSVIDVNYNFNQTQPSIIAAIINNNNFNGQGDIQLTAASEYAVEKLNQVLGCIDQGNIAALNENDADFADEIQMSYLNYDSQLNNQINNGLSQTTIVDTDTSISQSNASKANVNSQHYLSVESILENDSRLLALHKADQERQEQARQEQARQEQERQEQERQEQEHQEQERQEQERQEQERQEQERQEQERQEQERQEQERLEQERLEQERQEQERLEQERQEQEQQASTLQLNSNEEVEQASFIKQGNQIAENQETTDALTYIYNNVADTINKSYLETNTVKKLLNINPDKASLPVKAWRAIFDCIEENKSINDPKEKIKNLYMVLHHQLFALDEARNYQFIFAGNPLRAINYGLLNLSKPAVPGKELSRHLVTTKHTVDEIINEAKQTANLELFKKTAKKELEYVIKHTNRKIRKEQAQDLLVALQNVNPDNINEWRVDIAAILTADHEFILGNHKKDERYDETIGNGKFGLLDKAIIKLKKELGLTSNTKQKKPGIFSCLPNFFNSKPKNQPEQMQTTKLKKSK